MANLHKSRILLGKIYLPPENIPRGAGSSSVSFLKSID